MAKERVERLSGKSTIHNALKVVKWPGVFAGLGRSPETRKMAHLANDQYEAPEIFPDLPAGQTPELPYEGRELYDQHRGRIEAPSAKTSMEQVGAHTGVPLLRGGLLPVSGRPTEITPENFIWDDYVDLYHNYARVCNLLELADARLKRQRSIILGELGVTEEEMQAKLAEAARRRHIKAVPPVGDAS